MSKAGTKHRDPQREALFRRITQTPALCASFAKFLQLQFADENLLFWQDIQEFKVRILLQ